MNSDNEKFLTALNGEIWEEHDGFDRFRGKYKYHVLRRSLSKTELARVEEIFRSEPDIIFEPGSGPFGFGVSISAYKPGDVAGYVHLAPEFLIKLNDKHINPEDSARQAVYSWIEQFTHTDQNKHSRERNGFTQPLQSMSYYDY